MVTKLNEEKTTLEKSATEKHLRLIEQAADEVIIRDITERKQAEEELSKTNARLQVLQQVTAAVHSTLDLEEVFRQITDAAVHSLGYTTALILTLNDEKKCFGVKALSTKKRLLPQIGKALGFSLKSLSVPADPELNAVMASVMKGRVEVTKTLAEVAYPLISKKACLALQKLGSTKNCILVPLKIDEGMIGALFITSPQEEVSEADLTMLQNFAASASQAIRNANLHTQTKQAEKALQQSEENLKTYLESAPDGVYLSDLKGKFLYGNKKAEEIMGYNREKLVGKSFLKLNLLPKKHLVKAGKLLALNAIGRPTGPDEFELIREDGSRVWVEINTTPIKQHGEVVILGFVRDITERKRMEEELLRNRDLLNETGKMAKVGGWEFDVETLSQTWTDEVYHIHEVDMDFQPTVDSGISFYAPEVQTIVSKAVQRTIDYGEPFDLELPFITAKGNHRWVHAIGKTYRKNGKTIRVRGTFQDITERKQAEEALAEEATRRRILMEQSRDGIVVLDQDGKVYESNQRFAEMLEFSPEEVSQLHVWDWEFQFTREQVCDMLRNVDGAGDHFETQHRRKDGTIYDVEISTNGAVFAGQKLIFCVCRDITERKRMEEREKQLLQQLNLSSRLASVGEMASGIAHEINNPLTGVIGFTQLLMQRDIPEDIRKDVEIINNGAQRVASIVSRLLTFARQHKSGREYVNINDAITSVLELRSYEMKVNNTEVVTQLAPHLPQTMADVNQLQQVFLNIIINAEKEMTAAHRRGKLSVKTERINSSIRVSFTDDGPGISKENLDKVFNPFFTTREVGDGTGLGLSICHGIITQHNGRIYAQSELGKGATFVVELPIVTKTGQLEKAEAVQEAPRQCRGAKILVVDDEKSILDFLKRLLTGQGYQVETVDGTRAALTRLRRERYDLILLDIKLPGKGGIWLHRHIEAMDPALAHRVLFITGDVMETTTREFLDKTKVRYIAKPLNLEQLKRDINHMLTREPLRQQS